MKKIVGIMPIKMNNERLPGKNTMSLGGKPLLNYQLEALLETNRCESVNVFCSDKKIMQYLPPKVELIVRSRELDLPTSNFNQIFDEFIKKIDSEIYVYVHATAPFITQETINECIDAVVSGKYDSAFCAKRIQTYLWQEGKPLNFNAQNLPRTQDLKPIYQETSGVYVIKKETYLNTRRRVGLNPYIKEVTQRESIDIDTFEDFKIAEAMLKVKE